MQNLDTVIKVIKKILVKENVYHLGTSHDEIINHALEQQGVQKVINVLQRISDGDENLKELMKNIE